jgi:hypothetical protein
VARVPGEALAVFVVSIQSNLYGWSLGIGHKINSKFIVVEMRYQPPDGTTVIIGFANEHDSLAGMSVFATVINGKTEGETSMVAMRLDRFFDPNYSEAAEAI